jgi:hypothetical protein
MVALAVALETLLVLADNLLELVLLDKALVAAMHQEVKEVLVVAEEREQLVQERKAVLVLYPLLLAHLLIMLVVVQAEMVEPQLLVV